MFGSNASSPDLRRHSAISISDMRRRASSNLGSINFNRNSLPKMNNTTTTTTTTTTTSLLSQSLNDSGVIDDNEHAIDESPFGPLKMSQRGKLLPI